MSAPNDGNHGAPRPPTSSAPTASIDAGLDFLMGSEASQWAPWQQQPLLPAQHPQQHPQPQQQPYQAPPGYFGYPPQPAPAGTYAPSAVAYQSAPVPWFAPGPAPSQYADSGHGGSNQRGEGEQSRRRDSPRQRSRGRSRDFSPEPDWRDLAIRQLQDEASRLRTELRTVRAELRVTREQQLEQGDLITAQHRQIMGRESSSRTPSLPNIPPRDALTRTIPPRSQRYQTPPHRRPRSRSRTPPRRDRSPRLEQRRQPVTRQRRSASPVPKCAPPQSVGTAPPIKSSSSTEPNTPSVNLPRPAPPVSSPILPYSNDPYANMSDDEYGSEDSSEVRRRTKKYNDRASRTRARNASTPGAPGSGSAIPVVPGEARYHGRFANTPVVSTQDAHALMDAARVDDDALRYIDYLNTQLQQSTRNRTEGQHELITAWNGFIAFNGARRDRARTTVGLPLSKKVKKHLPPPPATAGPNSSRMDTDDAPATHASDEDHQRWIASLRPTQRGFAATPASQWPAGVRQMVNGEAREVPRGVGNVFLEPHDGDSVASSTSRRLAPLRVNQDARSNIRRQEFNRTWWGTFATRGLFARIAQELALSVGDREPEHFPYDTRNVDVIIIVRWALDHGIAPNSTMAGYLEEFAPLTLARQANLSGIPQRSLDEWVVQFGPLLHEASHTLQYPPHIPDVPFITTPSEIQLAARALATGVTGPAPTAAVSVPPASIQTTALTGPGDTASAATDSTTGTAAPTTLTSEDVDMDDKDTQKL
ncbi:hypothetical protein FIBSPDRAFT_901387 [Athelia psychrophila]|uniref:Uncharacterized protein n=1 Tax=Athelia psychrophila TaxID=1759441 RepID=A0A165X8E9_9AGAM|nr:hypothetical protein FIBSPDRAFT_901387 [Fibularhizoctonia sp. CBS 109695]